MRISNTLTLHLTTVPACRRSHHFLLFAMNLNALFKLIVVVLFGSWTVSIGEDVVDSIFGTYHSSQEHLRSRFRQFALYSRLDNSLRADRVQELLPLVSALEESAKDVRVLQNDIAFVMLMSVKELCTFTLFVLRVADHFICPDGALHWRLRYPTFPTLSISEGCSVGRSLRWAMRQMR